MSKELEKTHKPILIIDSNGVYYEVVFDFPYSPPEIECAVDTSLITGGVGKINAKEAKYSNEVLSQEKIIDLTVEIQKLKENQLSK